VLTSTGRTIAALAVVLIVAGWALGYAALLAIGVAFLITFLLGIAWVLRRPRVDAQREVRPVRVTVGGTAISELRLTNYSRRRTSGGVALEAFGRQVLPVVIPPLEPGASETVLQELPTGRRGVYEVGPLLMRRSDPFSLLQVGNEQQDVATLWVHPRTIDLTPLPSGVHRDLEGPDAGDAPEGGITFQNLREYVEGDDLRLVHWRSYAKTGTLMVRHNIDTHQPRSLVIFDTRDSVHDDDSFEEAVTAVASIIAASQVRRFPFRLETTCGTRIDHTMPRGNAFDALAGLRRVPIGSIERTVRQTSREQGASLAVISGRCSTSDLACIATVQTRFAAITIGRIGARTGGEVVLAPSALLINASNASAFARAWNRRMR
jgi:uncharacterized protein (DUF58 family)